jgi:hypothetical protein
MDRETFSLGATTNGGLEAVLSSMITIGIHFKKSALTVTGALSSHPVGTSIVAARIENALYFIRTAQDVWE